MNSVYKDTFLFGLNIFFVSGSLNIKIKIPFIIMEFPNKPHTNSKVYCCVQGCDSQAGRNRNLSFHCFPRAGRIHLIIERTKGKFIIMGLRDVWLKNLKIQTSASAFWKVCSRHFTKEDYRRYPGWFILNNILLL